MTRWEWDPTLYAGLRAVLTEATPDGRVAEQMRETALDVWRP